jgi:hypothetical protein
MRSASFLLSGYFGGENFREPSNLFCHGYLGTDLATGFVLEGPKYFHMQPSGSQKKGGAPWRKKFL